MRSSVPCRTSALAGAGSLLDIRTERRPVLLGCQIKMLGFVDKRVGAAEGGGKSATSAGLQFSDLECLKPFRGGINLTSPHGREGFTQDSASRPSSRPCRSIQRNVTTPVPTLSEVPSAVVALRAAVRKGMASFAPFRL